MGSEEGVLGASVSWRPAVEPPAAVGEHKSLACCSAEVGCGCRAGEPAPVPPVLLSAHAGGGHLVPLSYVYGYRGGVGRRGVAQDTIGDNDLDIRARVRRYQLILSRCAAGFVPKSAIWEMGRCGSTEKRPIWWKFSLR